MFIEIVVMLFAMSEGVPGAGLCMAQPILLGLPHLAPAGLVRGQYIWTVALE